MRRHCSPTIRIMLASVVASVGLFALSLTTGHVLAVDRGLDLTDEGSYLLAADPPQSNATWSFPYGWHTSPLLRAVGHDISRFRNYGAVILVVVSAWLGWSAVTVTGGTASSFARQNSPRSMSRRRHHSWLGAMVGAAGSLLYYAGFLRTPSYNWVNLVGITIAASAQVLLAGRLWKRQQVSFVAWALVITGSFGLFFTLPAKPSTSIFLVMSGFVFSAWLVGAKRAAIWSGALLGATILWVVVAVVAGLWPEDFASVFTRVLERPTPADSQTVIGAISSIVAIPLALVRSLIAADSSPSLVVASGLGALAGVTSIFACLSTSAPRWMWRASCIGMLLSALLLVGFPALGLEAMPTNRWAYAPLATSGLLVVGAVAAFVVAQLRSAQESTAPLEGAGRQHLATAADRTQLRKACAIPCFLLLLPFFFSFGSSWGAYAQAANATGIFLVAAVALLAIVGSSSVASRAAAVIAVVTFALVTLILYDGFQRPYRNPPISQHDVPVAVGAEGHRLLVDHDLAHLLTELKAEARASGWVRDTPIVGLLWRWSSTIPYFLDARVQDSLMLTIFGYSGTVDRARYNLDTSKTDFPFEQAWVVATSSDVLTDLGHSQVAMVVDALEAATNRHFPADYRCVAQVASFQIWKPAMTSSDGSNSNCMSITPGTSKYDASSGWQG